MQIFIYSLCGKQIPDGSKFCTNCGASQVNNQTPAGNQQQYQQSQNFQQPPPFQQPQQQYYAPGMPPQMPKKKKGGTIALVAILVIAAIIAGIIFIPRIFGPPEATKSPRAASIGFTQQNISVENTATIDNNGGVITLPSNSALSGSFVTVPATAVDQSVTVEVGTVTGTYTNAPESISQTALHLDLGGYEDLNQPIMITFQYARNAVEAERVPVGLYIDDTGKMTQMLTHSIDKENGQFTVLTFHASTFTYYILEDVDSYPDSYATGFLPSVDGFAEKNTGSSIFSGGECYGMSTFSKWFYLNKKTTETGGFYNLFRSPQMGVSPTGDVITPQDVIATKAFQYTTKESSILWDTERMFSSYVEKDETGNITGYRMDNSVSVRCIMDAIFFWEEPVEVGIYGEGGHSVLAYGYEKTSSKINIKIYDPNFPNDNTQKIVYDIASKTISTPSYPAGFLDVRLTTTGYGTFTSVSDYEDILADAYNNFAGTIADLEITDPANGHTVETGTYVISGSLDTLNMMGEQIGDMVEIISDNGQIFRQYLSKNGTSPSNFSVEVPLKSGENKFLFNIIYNDERGNENYMSHDQYGWFIINSTVPANAIYVTLTWDGQPDVDLYVTNPAGETSYFENYTTSDGGYLDIDDTNSYGPEHYTLLASDSVMWGQGYEIKLHYYNGNGPTSYNVIVTVNEGTRYEKTSYYSGIISSSGYQVDDITYNDAPGDSGPDWVYITTAVPLRDSD